ncbi:unnamed protein product, partial [Polarella glacialis]
ATATTRPKAATSVSKEQVSKVEANNKLQEKTHAKEETREFGGTLGTLFIAVSSHMLMFYMASSLYGSDVSLYIPTTRSLTWFVGYHISQVLLARVMPGVTVKTNGLVYLCNGYSSFFATFAGAGALHYAEVFDITILVKEYPAFLTTAILLGDIYAVLMHLCYARGWELISFYDFFIGLGVHPRIGKVVDIKMVAETRVSWNLLLLISVGCWVQSARELGSFCNPSAFMASKYQARKAGLYTGISRQLHHSLAEPRLHQVLAHLLYANACAKGEHFIPYTWDITTEKFGWMLCWWNLAGVPLLYCYQPLFLLKHSWAGLVLPPMPAVYYGCLSVALLLAYWMWDETNYQKCYFKAEMRGELLAPRNLFPTFRHVENPKYIKCDQGLLLIDGWYGKARKFHYTCDTVMALVWGLSCGFSSVLPYARCQEKYGESWQKYLKAVPYRFIPGVW